MSGSRAKARASGAKAKASGKATAAANGAGSSVKNGAKGVMPIARKAKVPLLASGTALVGVAGAIAATHSGKRHEVMGVSVLKANGMKPDASQRQAKGASAYGREALSGGGKAVSLGCPVQRCR